MKPLRPTVSEERWQAIAARFPRLRDAPAVRSQTGDWRTVGLMTRLALFGLGAVIAAATGSILALIGAPGPMLVVGLVLCAAAEWLIAKKRLCGAGVEEALSITGLLMIAFWVVSQSGEASDDVAMAAAAAAAFGLAGWRLRNPLFITLTALSIALLATVALDRDSSVWTLRRTHVAALTCYAQAVAALLAGGWRLRRPSTDRMLDWLVVVLPVAGFASAAAGAGPPLRFDELPQAGIARLYVPLAPLLFGAVALAAGLRRRTHAPLLATMLSAACVAWELRELAGMSPDAQLLLWGGLLLALAATLDRLLRTPRRGITSKRPSSGEDPMDLLQIAGAAALGPQARTDAARDVEGQGGGFGGGGASGRY